MRLRFDPRTKPWSVDTVVCRDCGAIYAIDENDLLIYNDIDDRTNTPTKHFYVKCQVCDNRITVTWLVPTEVAHRKGLYS